MNDNDKKQQPEGMSIEEACDKLFNELEDIVDVDERWIRLCIFALPMLQGLYGAFLQSSAQGEYLENKIQIGMGVLPYMMLERAKAEAIAQERAEATVEAREAMQGVMKQAPPNIIVPGLQLRPKKGRGGRNN